MNNIIYMNLQQCKWLTKGFNANNGKLLHLLMSII